MFSLSAIILLSSCSLAFGHYDFKATNCATDRKTFEIESVKLHTKDIEVPGKIEADVKFKIIKTPVAGKSYTLKVKMVKPSISFFLSEIPCINNVGSCSYNFCELFARKTKELSGDGTCPDNIVCSCDDLKPGTYTIPFSQEIPDDQLPMKAFLFGDYKLNATIVRDDTKEVLACVHLEFTMASSEECSGLFCGN